MFLFLFFFFCFVFFCLFVFLKINGSRFNPLSVYDIIHAALVFHVVGSRLYVLGGVCSVTKNALSSVECLDAETGEWMEDVEPLSSPALGLACVSVHLGDFDQ